MRKMHFILILIFTLGCSPKFTDNQIAEFEKVLGEKETKALNLLVFDFEQNLIKTYPDLTLEKAYQQYLTDLITDSTTDGEKFNFKTDTSNLEIHQSGLWNEIYTKDSESGLQINGAGKYMQALFAIKDSDSLINKYYEKREAAGIMQNDLVVPGILNMNPDFNNYFHKRIVVLEFSF